MKTGRNDPCHCGSGQKYKKCCLAKDDAARSAELAALAAKAAEAGAEGSDVEGDGKPTKATARARDASAARPNNADGKPQPPPIRRRAV
jgi:hypothetical protein